MNHSFSFCTARENLGGIVRQWVCVGPRGGKVHCGGQRRLNVRGVVRCRHDRRLQRGFGNPRLLNIKIKLIGATLGINSRPAKPGDLIVAYGIGFGAVTPSILPVAIVQQNNTPVNPATIAFGSTAREKARGLKWPCRCPSACRFCRSPLRCSRKKLARSDGAQAGNYWIGRFAVFALTPPVVSTTG
jgi:hypothetical protein